MWTPQGEREGERGRRKGKGEKKRYLVYMEGRKGKGERRGCVLAIEKRMFFRSRRGRLQPFLISGWKRGTGCGVGVIKHAPGGTEVHKYSLIVQKGWGAGPGDRILTEKEGGKKGGRITPRQ